MIDLLRDKKVLFISAHQDDESMYFGGALTQLKEISILKVISMTKPGAKRSDFKHRMGAFLAAVDMVGARYSIYDIENFRHDTPFKLACEPQMDEGVQIIKNEIKIFDPEILITHGKQGDPASAYPDGHIMHKFCNNAVHIANENKLTVFTSAISLGKGDFTLDYDVEAKRRMLSLYEPFWEPIQRGYSFCYEPEYFNQELPTMS